MNFPISYFKRIIFVLKNLRNLISFAFVLSHHVLRSLLLGVSCDLSLSLSFRDMVALGGSLRGCVIGFADLHGW